jgi:PelA/Pel-15E family pectate lyase
MISQRIGAFSALGLSIAIATSAGQEDLRARAQTALRKAVEFYRTRVATHGGYHFAYTEDLSYGRSEMSEGPSRVEIQRDGTPLVGMAYFEAYLATDDRYYLDAAREVAQTLVRGQYCSGGWDYYIEFDAQKRTSFPYRTNGNCDARATASQRPSTLDDNVTQAAVRLLMRTDSALYFEDAPIHEAARFALDSLVRAQYPNGAWPQRYAQFPDAKAFPVKRASYPDSWPRTWPGSNYQSHYTFNDNSIVDAIDAMLEAARVYNEPRYMRAAQQGGDFILLAQMPEPQPGWAQQYDAEMHPAWARRFEPPSITGGEARSIMKALLLLYRETGNRKYLEPLPRALAYYQRSILPETDKPSEARSRACPQRTPCAARFYELKTNRPLYITKGTRVTALDQGAATVDGYELSYSDASVITHYAVLVPATEFSAIEREFTDIQAASASALRRPVTLRGLSPWSEARMNGATNAFNARGSLESRVRAVIDAQDARGAWVEEGTIGKANRLVSVFAGKDLVVTLGGRPLPMKENDTLEVFSDPAPPKERIIRSRTFAENIGILSQYVGQSRR